MSTHSTPFPLAVSIREAVAITSISRSSIYIHLASGSLPSRKLGSRRVILMADLQAFVAALPKAPTRPNSV